jgi:hypothetical protein
MMRDLFFLLFVTCTLALVIVLGFHLLESI